MDNHNFLPDVNNYEDDYFKCEYCENMSTSQEIFLVENKNKFKIIRRKISSIKEELDQASIQIKGESFNEYFLIFNSPPKLSSVELAKNQIRQYDKSFSYFCNQHTFGHRCFICRIHFNFRRKVKLKWKVKFKNKVNIKRRKVNLKMRRGKCETIYCFYNLIILLFVAFDYSVCVIWTLYCM